MYIPHDRVSQLWTELLRTTHPLSPPIHILTALTVDSLCATRMLNALLKLECIQSQIHPISGYSDLQRAGNDHVLPLTRQRGGQGGVVVCLGVGGLVDLEETLGLDGNANGAEGAETEDMRDHGVEVWVIDARRPWNLQNLFGSGVAAGELSNEASAVGLGRAGVDQGRVMPSYRAGKGGVIVWVDENIGDELAPEREAFLELQRMPDIDEQDLLLEGVDDDDEHDSSQSRKRRASEVEDGEESEDEQRPRQRRRSNSSTPIPSSPHANPQSAQVHFDSTPPTSSQPRSPGAVVPSSPPKQPSQRQLKRQLLKLRRKHEATLDAYYSLGTSYADPVSCVLYNLAGSLGREDNDLLWLAIVGTASIDHSPFSHRLTAGDSRRHIDNIEHRRAILRDEVTRLNPEALADIQRNQNTRRRLAPPKPRGPTDTSVAISAEPKLHLMRHWSLYDSMQHSSFLATRLQLWSERGHDRMRRLFAKMGVSLIEARKDYRYMNEELKTSLCERILKFAEQYNLEGLVPGDNGRSGYEGWGFVRHFGHSGSLSADDVAVTVGAILEVGSDPAHGGLDIKFDRSGPDPSFASRLRMPPTPPSEDGLLPNGADVPDWITHRYFAAYDALDQAAPSSRSKGLNVLLKSIPTAQNLQRAILRTGSMLISKRKMRRLTAFRMGVLNEGQDLALFTHPGALTRLAAWVSEAHAVQDAERGEWRDNGREGALVLACLDEARAVYVVVGLGGGGAGGKRVRSKAEIKEREDKRKRKEATRAAKKAEKARKNAEKKRLIREIQEANGLLDSDDEEGGSGDESDETESASSSDDGSDSDDDDDGMPEARKEKGYGLNRFGQAFQEVVEETAARVRIDSFEHSVVEVRKDDFAVFLEALSGKRVVG